MSPGARLASIVKAYDVRGLVGTELTAAGSESLGFAFARQVAGPPHDARSIVVGHDMRNSSTMLANAFTLGARMAGLDVDFIGLASTDMLYFAAGVLGKPGAMFTASHNPAAYNGIKLCLAGAKPISLETGLAAIRDEALAVLDSTGGFPREPIGLQSERPTAPSSAPGASCARALGCGQPSSWGMAPYASPPGD